MIVCIVAAGCASDPPDPTRGPTATADPDPALSASLAVASLAKASFDPTSHLVICDPYPNQISEDAGEASVMCGDGALLALRAITHVGGTDVQRLYLRRAPCDAGPCPDDALHTARVSAWLHQGRAWVAVDSRLDRVTVTAADGGVAWPTIKSPDPASGEPISIADAPADLARREPVPSCGAVDIAEETVEVAERCFLAAVLRGEKVELLERLYSVEGDPVTVLYRFEGRGAVIRSASGESGVWQRYAGGLILDPDGGFSFDPWPDTESTLE